jgi:DNA polymerase bacteriophage-type
MLRSMITAPEGRKLIAADYAGIEARALLWAAGEMDACRLIEAGGDLYKEMAAEIYGIPVADVTKAQRGIGKIAILGLGYGMGSKTFKSTCTNWGIEIPEDEAARAVSAYRRKFPGVVQFWRDMEKAALRAVEGTPWAIPTPDGSCFTFVKPERTDTLALQLPSGRRIHYQRPKVTAGQYGNALQYECNVKGDTWGTLTTWGGELVENAIQAACNDLLRAAVLRVESAGWPVVLTVHDEIVTEVPDLPEYTPEALASMMIIRPQWAPTVPIAAEGWEGRNFKK